MTDFEEADFSIGNVSDDDSSDGPGDLDLSQKSQSTHEQATDVLTVAELKVDELNDTASASAGTSVASKDVCLTSRSKEPRKDNLQSQPPLKKACPARKPPSVKPAGSMHEASVGRASSADPEVAQIGSTNNEHKDLPEKQALLVEKQTDLPELRLVEPPQISSQQDSESRPMSPSINKPSGEVDGKVDWKKYGDQADSLWNIYASSALAFPPWSKDRLAAGELEEYAQTALVYCSKEDDLEKIKRVATEREPSNMEMQRCYKVAELKEKFGYEYGAYCLSTEDVLMPNIAVYTKTPITDGKDFASFHVINAIGVAFDTALQPDRRYFFKEGAASELVAGMPSEKWEELIQHMSMMWHYIFECAKQHSLKHVYLASVGGGIFKGPLTEQQYDQLKQQSLQPVLNAYPDIECHPLPRIPEWCFSEEGKKRCHDSLLVNAWNPWSMVGNGNADDNSLDGFYGRCSALAVLCWPITNPLLKYERVDRLSPKHLKDVQEQRVQDEHKAPVAEVLRSTEMEPSEPSEPLQGASRCLEHEVDLSDSDDEEDEIRSRDEEDDERLPTVCKTDDAPAPATSETQVPDIDNSATLSQLQKALAEIRAIKVSAPDTIDEPARPMAKKMPKKMPRKPLAEKPVEKSPEAYEAEKEKDELRESTMSTVDTASSKKKRGIVLTRDADIQLTSNAITALKAWLADETRKAETEFEVIETNAYLRRFMHETFASEFQGLFVESRPTARRGVSKMFAMRLTEEQKVERAKKVQARKEVKFVKASLDGAWAQQCESFPSRFTKYAKGRLDGEWTQRGQHVASISDTSLFWLDGNRVAISKDVTGNKFFMNWNGEHCMADLQDDGKLHWSDGDIWERQASPPPPPPPPPPRPSEACREACFSPDGKEDVLPSDEPIISSTTTSSEDAVPSNEPSRSSKTAPPEGWRVLSLNKAGSRKVDQVNDVSNTRVNKRQSCRYWARHGKCQFGDSCKFFHESRSCQESDENLLPDWKRWKGDDEGKKMSAEATDADMDAKGEKMIAEASDVDMEAKVDVDMEAKVDPYLVADVEETMAENKEDPCVDVVGIDDDDDDIENPIAAEFRLAFNELPTTGSEIAEQFMTAFEELPESDSQSQNTLSIKPSRSRAKNICCSNGHTLLQGSYYDRSCNTCSKTATAYRCSDSCDYDLCTACYESAKARTLASPQQSDHSSTPSQRKTEADAITSLCPEMQFARKYLAKKPV